MAQRACGTGASSLVAGLVIPATIGATFIALRMMGESFNLMTLGGLAAAVGLGGSTMPSWW